MSLLDSPAVARTAPALESPVGHGRLAVSLHDVEPRSFARCKQIREWLLARGVERITLLVIPAADLHPIGARAPALAAWLRSRVARGDTVAQHGLVHKLQVRGRWPRSVIAGWQGGEAAEFPGLNRDQTARRVRMGRSLLRELELDPIGFVAPGYAYTRALRDELAGSFEWFADLRAIQICGDRARIKSPALCLGSSTALKRALSPAIVRAAARKPKPVMRVDIHPADFDLPVHVATLETLLARAAGRDSVTYDELLAPDGHQRDGC
jgi:predicted deacetylase